MLHLIGGLQDGAMVLAGASPGPNNTTVLTRVTWTAMPDGRVRQFWQVSADQGKTRTVSFGGYYRKQR